MGLTMKERKAVTAALAERYRKAGKKQKARMLDEFTALTGYNRDYAAWLLGWQGRRVRLGRITLVAQLRDRLRRRPRPRKYDTAVREALQQVWWIMDYACGKRLAAMLPELLPILERHGEIALPKTVREKLLVVSPATIDRLLAAERKRLRVRGRSGTKPGTLLKHQIPIRTFAEWDEQKLGFVEMDLVGHDGGDASGEFLQTLDAVDVASGWTETQAVRNKAQVWVFEALQQIRGRLPFPLLGVDSDNGSEFINAHLLRYCRAEQITFTRSRAWRKNDNCFVEQKNYSVVRRAVGDARYDTLEQLRLLNKLYSVLRLYTNFFQPVMKLIAKERNGAKVRKTYDKPQTPYRRVLNSPAVAEDAKAVLRTQYAKLNPAELKRQISRLQDHLLKTAAARARVQKRQTLDEQATSQV
jgi:hypothetical protein